MATNTGEERYRLLLDLLIAEQPDRGAKTRVARMLGIDKSTLTKIQNGEREPGLESIQKAIQRLKIDSSFFYGPTTPREWKSYVRGAVISDERVPTTVLEYLSEMGDRVSPEHADALRSIEWKGAVPSFSTVAGVHADLRNGDAAARRIAPPALPAGVRSLKKAK